MYKELKHCTTWYIAHIIFIYIYIYNITQAVYYDQLPLFRQLPPYTQYSGTSLKDHLLRVVLDARWSLPGIISTWFVKTAPLEYGNLYVLGETTLFPGGALPLWESVGMRRGFVPHFRHLDDLFASQNLTLSTILFRSCWVSFRNPHFQHVDDLFAPQNWPNLSFYSDLVGSHFELRAAHPYCFWPRVPPPGGCSIERFHC